MIQAATPVLRQIDAILVSRVHTFSLIVAGCAEAAQMDTLEIKIIRNVRYVHRDAGYAICLLWMSNVLIAQ